MWYATVLDHPVTQAYRIFKKKHISLTENLEAKYFLQIKKTFYNLMRYFWSGAFITATIRTLLLVSPSVFFAIDTDSFTYMIQIISAFGVLFDLCIRQEQ